MLAKFLSNHIPAFHALNLQVILQKPDEVRILAPYQENHNHHQSIFGGSQALVATLSAWSWVHLNFPKSQGNIVIATSQIKYIRPAKSDIIAITKNPDTDALHHAKTILDKKGKSKITLTCQLFCNDELVSEFIGVFVIFNHN